MIRKLLMVVLPLLLPTLIYMAYMLVERRRAVASGDTPLPWWAGAPWATLVISGVALSAIVLITVAVTGGSEVHRTYYPTHPIDGRKQGGETTPTAPHSGR